jgi:predicted O-methyltransferase YrrM
MTSTVHGGAHTGTFQDRLRLAIADPCRAGAFLYYRSLNFLRNFTNPERTECLDDRLMQAMSGVSGVEAAREDEKERIASGAQVRGMLPLMQDERTFNPEHPGYEAKLVRNHPGRIFNRWQPCRSPTYSALSRMAPLNFVPDFRWRKPLSNALAEIKTIPHAEQIFERRRFTERYVAKLRRTYDAQYQPGWVNLQDAAFLYWLVRRAKPKTIVQTGVCNGLSSAFMILALVKNGQGGRLHAIDMPRVFAPDEPRWTIPGKFYEVIIPQGETSGWLVPDAYRDRFDLRIGDAKELLPKLVDEIGTIDFFYHDSDHSYNHMMFEFRQARRKIKGGGGLVVGDDVSWSSSMWDFADEYGVPSYNFKGSVGVAFF